MRTAAFLILVCMVAGTQPASAKIVKTKGFRELALVVGSGIEYQSDSDQTEYGYPFLLEYGPSDALKITLEPSYVSLRDKNVGRTVQGLGDFETTFNGTPWIFLQSVTMSNAASSLRSHSSGLSAYRRQVSCLPAIKSPARFTSELECLRSMMYNE